MCQQDNPPTIPVLHPQHNNGQLGISAECCSSRCSRLGKNDQHHKAHIQQHPIHPVEAELYQLDKGIVCQTWYRWGNNGLGDTLNPQI